MLIQFRDYLHEQCIDAEKAALIASATPKARRIHADEMRRLISARSPEQVEKMERERGLA